ncbi:MAG: TetR/AcrR family transcriptional regulator [Acidimicrobiales bacterium]|nr:MAG: TetR/AcrR family transcriptional regulator [Acidimicrobiales bacterium]
MTMSPDGPIDEPIDGRRARRQRSREAVVSAAFELILEGKGPPSAEEVAERAGVSVSSIFRNFDGLADIQQQALELFGERYSHLLLARPPSGSDLDSRIAFFVRTRLDLYEQANPLMVMARMRAFEDERWREHIASNRSMLTRQLRACFDPEIDGLTPAGAADLIAVLDSLTSPEAFELMTRAHARTHRQIARAWEASLLALIDNCYIWGLTPDVTPSTPKGKQ